MLELNYDYEDALKRIRQLEKLNATLAAEIDAQRQREQATGEAYLRLRRLIGKRAFDTPYGPTAQQVWTTTEMALARLVAEADRMRPIVTAARDWYDGKNNWSVALAEAMASYEAGEPK